MSNEDGARKLVLFRVPRAVWVPGCLSFAALLLAVILSPWALLGIPFVWLGAWCSAPNMNLADGFLAMVAIFVGLMVAPFTHWGFVVFISTFTSWVLGGFERGMRAYPVERDK